MISLILPRVVSLCSKLRLKVGISLGRVLPRGVPIPFRSGRGLHLLRSFRLRLRFSGCGRRRKGKVAGSTLILLGCRRRPRRLSIMVTVQWLLFRILVIILIRLIRTLRFILSLTLGRKRFTRWSLRKVLQSRLLLSVVISVTNRKILKSG